MKNATLEISLFAQRHLSQIHSSFDAGVRQLKFLLDNIAPMNIAIRPTPVGFGGKLRVYPTKPTGVGTRFVIGEGRSMDNLDTTLLDVKGPREGTSRCSGSEVSLEYEVS